MQVLILINDAPYGTEKAYNGLRLAMNLQRTRSDVDVRVFLMTDAVTCALRDQRTPDGHYNVGTMLKAILGKGGQVRICGGCASARGIGDLQLIDGTEMSRMDDLSQWVVDSDRVVSF